VSKRLGERLIDHGKISRAQLDQALKAQLIFGGHLGTNLIELGFVDERTLVKTLAEIYRVRPAAPEMFDQIPEPVLSTLSVEIVERYRVVPVGIERNNKKNWALHLAVIEPRSVPPISSVGRFTKIVPWVAPEVRILHAMERYYGIPRRPRYINLAHELERGRRRAHPVASGMDSPARGALAAPDLPPEPDPLEAPGGTALATADMGEEYGYGRSWREVAREIFDEPGEAADGAAPRGAAAVSTAPTSLGLAANRMSRAESKDDLAAAVLEHVCREGVRGIMFAVRNEAVRVWDWKGVDLDGERVRKLRFPITSGSVFELLLGNDQYRGPVPDESSCRWFFSALRIPVPAEIQLLPVYVNDRLIAILYADGGPNGRIQDPVEEFQRLVRKLSLALNMLILKMKIRSA